MWHYCRPLIQWYLIKEEIWRHTHMNRGMPHADEGRDPGDAYTSQGPPRIPNRQPEREREA